MATTQWQSGADAAAAQRNSSLGQVAEVGEATATRSSNGTVLQLRVVQGVPSLVPPAGETPKGLYFLSNIDQVTAFLMWTVHCFKAHDQGNNKVTEVIKEALAKLLVHYYPLAGRLVVTAEERLAVGCTGEGAVFVEAHADCSLGDLGDMATCDPEVLEKLVYVPAAQNVLELPPLMAQVTKFKCGGFIFGLAMNHCMADGVTAMELTNSWGETARGLPLSVPPFLDRTILGARVPPKIDHPPFEFLATDDSPDTAAQGQYLTRSFNFNPATLEQLKKTAVDDGTLSRCTTFEALSCFLWRARTAALRLHTRQQMTELSFSIDVRARLNPPLPKGYFGNAIIWVRAVCAAEELVQSPLSFAVGMVQKAVMVGTDGYIRSFIDYLEQRRGKANKPSVATHLITVWSRLSFSATDFGWGEPVQFWPVDQPKDVTILLPQGKERKGMSVVLCLPANAMASFQELVRM